MTRRATATATTTTGFQVVHVPTADLAAKASCESWRPVRGERYDVSDFGRVRNAETGRVLTPYATPTGYLHVTLGHNRKRSVHRLVAEAFHGSPEPFREVNHLDGDKANNAASNLAWVTHAENQRHAYRVLGTLKLNLPVGRGERNTQAKLTEPEVVAIRRAVAEGQPQRAVAREFGVSQPQVSVICAGKAWSHTACSHTA